MTTEERIQELRRHGLPPSLVAAILDVDRSDVETYLADPENPVTPPTTGVPEDILELSGVIEFNEETDRLELNKNLELHDFVLYFGTPPFDEQFSMFHFPEGELALYYDGPGHIWSWDEQGVPQWKNGANVATTVGAAGLAAALPATPKKYLKVRDNDGNPLVIPAYLP